MAKRYIHLLEERGQLSTAASWTSTCHLSWVHAGGSCFQKIFSIAKSLATLAASRILWLRLKQIKPFLYAQESSQNQNGYYQPFYRSNRAQHSCRNVLSIAAKNVHTEVACPQHSTRTCTLPAGRSSYSSGTSTSCPGDTWAPWLNKSFSIVIFLRQSL